MAQVDLRIAGRIYEIACRDGEEERLLKLAAIVDAKATQAGSALGGVNETRHLLMAALLLADELAELRAAATSASATTSPPDAAQAWPGLAPLLAELADRLESVAHGLEERTRTP